MIRLKSLLLEQDSTTKKLNVLFVGDSQTVASYSYARQLINNGIVSGDIDAKSGISMKSIYSKFRSKYEPGKYDLISILGGNNDASSKNFDKLSYEKIIAAAKENNTPVVIVTSPTMKYIDTKLYPSKYPSQDRIPAWQKSLESENVMVLDAYDLMDMKSNFVSDGLHLTKDSHTLLMKTWILIVKKKFPNLINSDKISSSIDQQGSLKYGDVGEDVKQAQERLINLNYSVGPELNDGIFGPHTRDGVIAFQNVNKLTDNGIIDTSMFELIKSSNAKPCPSNIRKQLDNKIIASSPSSSPTITSNFNDDAAEQAFPMIIKYEGFRPTSYMDSDGYHRIGYGSSTLTQPDGTIIKMGRKKSAYVITRADADRDLHRRIKDEFLPGVLDTIRKWGQDPNKFNAATLAVLTSVKYNYGSLKTALRPAIQSGDAAQVAYAIQALSANKSRRKQEGDYILASLDSNQKTDDVNNVSNKNNTDGDNPDADVKLSTLASAAGAFESGEEGQPGVVPVSYSGEFKITSKYGMRRSGMHRGLDIHAVVGTTIYVKKPGVVIFAGDRDPAGWGNMVEIKHTDGSITRYAHLARIDVAKNDQITPGMLIGLTGGKRHAPGAGNSQGPHLHWEWLPAGAAKGQDGISVVDDYCSFSKPAEEEIPAEDGENDNELSLKSIMNSIIN